MIVCVTSAVQATQTGFSVVGCTAQDRGGRAEQQDRAAILRSRRAPRCVLGLLADGVGGRSGGALASEQVLRTAQRCFDEFGADEPVQRFFEDLVSELHVVLQLSGATTHLQPHSTLAAVLVQPRRVDWCHVGDSRVYHVRDGRAVSHTVDHTVREQLIGEGRLSAERARLHPSAAMLTQALGGTRAPCPTVTGLADPVPGDAFVLCTDGAWSYLGDDEIAALACGRPPRDAAAALLACVGARSRGAGDNCSIVLLRLDRAT